jgi:anti-sigma factor RsiW
MNHPEQEKWMSYLYGELDEPEQKEMTKHLEACADCKSQVRSWQSTMIKLDSWKVPSVSRSRATHGVWFQLMRWSAAAVILLGAGVWAGWLGASNAVDPEALQREIETSLTASLKPMIEQDLRQQLSQEMVVTLANYRAQVSEALYQQIQLQLKEYAIQTLTVSGAQTNQLLEQLLEAVKVAHLEERLEERKIYGRIVNQLGTEQEQLRNEFALFAQETSGRLVETQKNVAQLLLQNPTGIEKRNEPEFEPDIQ